MIGKAAGLAALAGVGAVAVEVGGGSDVAQLALQVICGAIMTPVALAVAVRRWPGDPVRSGAALGAVPAALETGPAGNAVVMALPAGDSQIAA